MWHRRESNRQECQMIVTLPIVFSVPISLFSTFATVETGENHFLRNYENFISKNMIEIRHALILSNFVEIDGQMT